MFRPTTIVALGAFALAPFAIGAPPLHNELGFQGDLPNVPTGSPLYTIPAPGVTHVATGLVGTNFIDVDFITIRVPFATNRLVIDLDTNFTHQNSVLGVGGFMQYPSNPLLINDDDLDGTDDLLAGHAIVPTDSLVDVTGVLGGPIPANSVFTIAIGRQGEDSIGWNGTANLMMKLEYQLYVYTEIVPAPGPIGTLAIAGAFAARRRRR